MSFRIERQFRSGVQSFNMIPIIDIVFLLIIFFLVVCQFIDAENFPVDVPDGCEFAQSEPEPGTQVTTVTVMKTDKEGNCFVVGSEKITASNYADVVERIAELIDARLEGSPPEERIVTLRIDKDICFAEAQYVLAGVAMSSVTNIQLAALKNKRSDVE